MADKRTFERDARVEVYADGAWLPALIKNVVPVSGSAAGSGAYNYTVQVDLAGQPQFTNRPVRDYPLMKAVSAASIRERGSNTDGSNVPDAYIGTTVAPEKDAFARFLGLKTSAEYYAENDLGADGRKKDDPEAEAASLTTANQTAVKSDKRGNVTHGANASVEFVGDVTGTNGTGSVNANGQVPAALPDTPVNQTPYTVEASNDPHLGLHLTNLPNTGVKPEVLVVGDAPDEVQTKTGNDAPVNPTRKNGKDGKVVASDRYDGAIASATPVGSKDDHQTADAKQKDGEKDGVAKQKYPAIDNQPLNEGEADPAKEADGTHGTTAVAAEEAADQRAKEAEKTTDAKNKDMKPTQAQHDSVVDVQSKPASEVQKPASDTKATDGAVPDTKAAKK